MTLTAVGQNVQAVLWENWELTLNERVRAFVLALVLHLGFFALIARFEPPKSDGYVGSSAQPASVHVRVENAPKKGESAPRTVSVPLTALPGRASSTAPRIPVARITPTAFPESRDTPAQPESASVPVPSPETDVPAVPTPNLFPSNSRLSHLLPYSSSRFRDEQRAVGYESGRDHEQREDFIPLADSPENLRRRDRPMVVATEFSTLAYRLQLEKRFAEAWGGVRVLPSGSTFVGKSGELIVYNVIVNRDGTLRRIVNASALEQGDRDFSSVDRLVQAFADSVFPLNPLPDRIRDDPFVIRWPIRYMGFHYSFF